MVPAGEAIAALAAASISVVLGTTAPAATTQAAPNAKLLAFRTLCAEEGFQAGTARVPPLDYLTPDRNGGAPMDEFFDQFSGNAANRNDAKRNFRAALDGDKSAFHRANMALAACTIYFTEASEIGIPPNVMISQWKRERAEVYGLSTSPEPAAPQQEDDPPPAAIMARSVCFNEARAFDAALVQEGRTAADAVTRLNDLLKRFSETGSARDNRLRSGRDPIDRATTPLNRAGAILSLCAAHVGHAADSGVRDAETFRAQWADARARFAEPLPPAAAPAAPSVPAPATPRDTSSMPASTSAYRMRAVRSVCSDEIKRFTDERTRAGRAAGDAEREIGDILETMLGDAEPRAQVLNDFDTMAREATSPGDASRLSLSACAASVGALWSMGMRGTGELSTFWNGRGSARFAIPGFDAKSDAIGCVWVEFDAPPNTNQGTFRNTCRFTVDIRYCAQETTAGTAPDTIACAKGLSRFERIEPQGSVRMTPGHGNVSWYQCKVPQQPVQTSAPGAAFAAVCK